MNAEDRGAAPPPQEVAIPGIDSPLRFSQAVQRISRPRKHPSGFVLSASIPECKQGRQAMKLPPQMNPILRNRPPLALAAPAAAIAPAATTAITFQNNADAPAIATVRWGDIDVGNCGAAPDSSCTVGTEWVWYDVYAKHAATNALLASKKGVYGNSSVVLVQDAGGYRLI
jgi:hypothetical protein